MHHTTQIINCCLPIKYMHRTWWGSVMCTIQMHNNIRETKTLSSFHATIPAIHIRYEKLLTFDDCFGIALTNKWYWSGFCCKYSNKSSCDEEESRISRFRRMEDKHSRLNWKYFRYVQLFCIILREEQVKIDRNSSFFVVQMRWEEEYIWFLSSSFLLYRRICMLEPKIHLFLFHNSY